MTLLGHEALCRERVALSHLELLEVVLPRRAPFQSAIGWRTEERVLLVRWWWPDGSWGIGESSCRADPFFSGEFVDGAWLMVRDHLAPLLPRDGTVGEVAAACRRVRGWPFSTAAVLSAAVDSLRRRGVPDPIDRWDGPRLPAVPIGVSLGLQPSAEQAVEAAHAAHARGFQRFKFKISPGTDIGALWAVRAAFPEHPISADANGSFAEEDIGHLASLAALGLLMLEQPFPPGRLDLDQKLKAAAPSLPICLDEGLTDPGALYVARAMGVLDVANIKPGRVGGPLACDRVLRWCRAHGVSAWVGGMFETGVGRHANLRVASCLPDAVAHDASAPAEYLAEDIVADPLVMAQGRIPVGDAPVSVCWAQVERFCTRRLVLR